ncbi:ArsR/SmtB family transcription factor [Nevskia soli]|uniref:ArsR/SmtB family transcription factor n=1 Tax=Nevskia soli TaxID=418856 RepID=UPI00068C92DD|nr:metalloregulator ArsR/SmtB family transcription factor [Nevskia soli]
MTRTATRKIAEVELPALHELELHAGEAEALLRAMANRHRLMILCTLSQGELSVGALNERVPLSQSALSQHLAVLRADGLVSTRRESQTIYYSVPDGPALDIIHVLYSTYCCAPGAKGSRRKRVSK